MSEIPPTFTMRSTLNDTFRDSHIFEQHNSDNNSKSRHVQVRSHDATDRLVVVRYFLDRPGYGLHNSAARFWFRPPAQVKPCHVRNYLTEQGIALDGFLVEIYLDRYESFMLLDACEACDVEWDFEGTTTREPGVINVRLTDLGVAKAEENMLASQNWGIPTEMDDMPKQTGDKQRQLANTIPAGLFSFSMMLGLETAALTGKLIPGSVSQSFVLAHGPYMLFVGGLLQLLVGVFQIPRNNIYGTVAFLTFGSFWLANGLTLILRVYFLDESSDLLTMSDPLGAFFRSFFVFAFSMALLKQTFVMNKLTSTLISLLCLQVFVSALTGFNAKIEWVQFAFGWITAVFSFYVFLVELTNEVYQREVFPVYRWSEKHSPEEVFGAAGRTGTLHSKAARLRQASYPNIRKIREAQAHMHIVQEEGKQEG